jgi:hypothetical protein
MPQTGMENIMLVTNDVHWVGRHHGNFNIERDTDIQQYSGQMSHSKHLDQINIVFLVTIMLVDTFTEFTIHIHHNVIHLT